MEGDKNNSNGAAFADQQYPFYAPYQYSRPNHLLFASGIMKLLPRQYSDEITKFGSLINARMALSEVAPWLMPLSVVDTGGIWLGGPIFSYSNGCAFGFIASDRLGPHTVEAHAWWAA